MDLIMKLLVRVSSIISLLSINKKSMTISVSKVATKTKTTNHSLNPNLIFPQFFTKSSARALFSFPINAKIRSERLKIMEQKNVRQD